MKIIAVIPLYQQFDYACTQFRNSGKRGSIMPWLKLITGLSF